MLIPTGMDMESMGLTLWLTFQSAMVSMGLFWGYGHVCYITGEKSEKVLLFVITNGPRSAREG